LNNKQNLHTHTTYVDGKNTLEELILKAIEKNFTSIGFSEHSYLQYSTFSHQLTPKDMLSYKEEIQQLKKKYMDVIDVFCGLEYDFYSDVDTEGFDYLIGSVHYLECGEIIEPFDKGLKETLAYVKSFFGNNSLAFAKKYFETVARLPEKCDFDILGHFDIITKNNEQYGFIDISSKEYLNAGFEAIHSLKGKIPFFEVNTGAISRGYKSLPYPQMEFLKEFRKCGFGAVITSDCHDKSFIDCHFEEAAELLLAAGFRSKWILTCNGFEEVSL
jgi:histidinol-phosphatase (PHP family)